MTPVEAVPRQIVVPHRRISLEVPEGLTPVEFFNSPANLRNLAEENGLLRTPEDLLLYRKAIGHSLEFDTSIILDTSRRILDPLGRPVRRDQLSPREALVWARMTQVVFRYMLETFPDPEQHLVFCGEASLDATWPLGKSGVPSIRMIHNHFIAYPNAMLADAEPAAPDDPNLTDGGHHGLFLEHLERVYLRFLEVLDLQFLSPVSSTRSALRATGYPRGLPCWEVQGGADRLGDPRFWMEYDQLLRGFLDFYDTFFTQVSTRSGQVREGAYFPDQIANVLLFDDEFMRVARQIRVRVLTDSRFANDLRWRPAYKQMLYRDCTGRLIVTISQNSVGNAITELLGIVVRRVEDEEAYAHAEPALLARLLEVRQRLIDVDLGEAVSTSAWP